MREFDLTPITSLPVNSDESWEVGVVDASQLFPLPAAPDGVESMMLLLWRSSTTEMIHGSSFLASPDDMEANLQGIMEGLLAFQDLHEFSFRPGRIRCNGKIIATKLKNVFLDAKLPVEFVPNMPQWNDVLREMANQLEDAISSSNAMPSFAESAYQEEQLRTFAQAAANFYRAGFWNHLEDIDLIKLESPKPPNAMRYAVVLGAGEQTYGLGFYSDEQIHYDLMAQRVDPRELSLMNLSYESVADVCPDDVQLWNELQLPLETGEAFPEFRGFSADGPRHPTAKELEYVTIVLEALSQTTEEEIDSGVWTKTIDFRGKKKRCKFSIPNLTDPPDHTEWMRRGMMPERRGHERHFQMIQDFINQQEDISDIDELNQIINEKFTGSMEDVEYPMDTPSDRASAFCQEAIESFGRRRIQLARQAVQEDPNHVEALVLLAETTRVPEKRIAAFRAAVEAGRRELGSLFEDNVGHFWGITQTRPFMRACHGLADALHGAGQSNDAIKQYQEMLHLNPGDNQGIRYEIFPLLLSQNREAEAVELLAKYDEDSALWCYMKSLVEYRQHGPAAAKSRQAMLAAFKANEHVVTELQSDDPPYSPEAYAVGSVDEAMYCIEQLGESWMETDGYTEFMLAQFFKWEKDRQKKQRDAKRRARGKVAKGKKRRGR